MYCSGRNGNWRPPTVMVMVGSLGSFSHSTCHKTTTRPQHNQFVNLFCYKQDHNKQDHNTISLSLQLATPGHLCVDSVRERLAKPINTWPAAELQQTATFHFNGKKHAAALNSTAVSMC